MSNSKKNTKNEIFNLKIAKFSNLSIVPMHLNSSGHEL